MMTVRARSLHLGARARLLSAAGATGLLALVPGCGSPPNPAATAPVTGNWTGSMEGFGFPFTARFNGDGTFVMDGRWQGSHGPVSQVISGTYTRKEASLDVQTTRYVYTDYLGARTHEISPMQGRLTDGGRTLTVSYASENGAFKGGYVFHR